MGWARQEPELSCYLAGKLSGFEIFSVEKDLFLAPYKWCLAYHWSLQIYGRYGRSDILGGLNKYFTQNTFNILFIKYLLKNISTLLLNIIFIYASKFIKCRNPKLFLNSSPTHHFDGFLPVETWSMFLKRKFEYFYIFWICIWYPRQGRDWYSLLKSIMLIDLYSEYLPLPSPVSRLVVLILLHNIRSVASS